MLTSRGTAGVKASELTVQQHVDVLALATHYVDSAVSKTCNVGEEVTFEEFKQVYVNAYNQGCKGITTFRAAGKRYGILVEAVETEETGISKTEEVSEEVRTQEAESSTESGASACFIDPVTGTRDCG